MARARQDTCPHPYKRHERISFGRYRCTRCDLELTPAGRKFTVRHSDRVTLSHGDRVAVGRSYHGGAFQGVFLHTCERSSELAYVIAEVQRYTVDKTTYEGWARVVTVRPEHVRQAAGVRDRKRREEQTVA